jgi:hypothetical protein
MAWFGSRVLRAHKAAAHSSRVLRELAGVNLGIELRLLLKWQEPYQAVLHSAYVAERLDLARPLADALESAGECIDRVDYTTSGIMAELGGTYARPRTVEQYAALDAYERDVCACLVELTAQLRGHLETLSTRCADCEQAGIDTNATLQQ